MALRRDQLKYTLRETLFRLACRHRQGSKPNILLYCTRRGGSVWILNTLAAHSGMRFTARPFRTIPHTRYASKLPDLAVAAGDTSGYGFHQVIHFEDEAERRFERLARGIIRGDVEIYPTLRFGAPYFNRITDRIAFQMTSGVAMIDWFHDRFDVNTVILTRHPISNALSIMNRKWAPECEDFLRHRWFVDQHLTGRQADLARKIVAGTDELAKHVLDWSLKMLLPLRGYLSGERPDWTLITYEETVLETSLIVRRLSRALDLPDEATMREQARRPSRTVTATTADKIADQDYLLHRWRARVDADEERELLAIPEALGIPVYLPGRNLAIPSMLVRPRDVERGFARSAERVPTRVSEELVKSG